MYEHYTFVNVERLKFKIGNDKIKTPYIKQTFKHTCT